MHGGNIFNILPSDIGKCTKYLEILKIKLDIFLSEIPDHPVSPGLTPIPINTATNKHSNFLFN